MSFSLLLSSCVSHLACLALSFLPPSFPPPDSSRPLPPSLSLSLSLPVASSQRRPVAMVGSRSCARDADGGTTSRLGSHKSNAETCLSLSFPFPLSPPALASLDATPDPVCSVSHPPRDAARVRRDAENRSLCPRDFLSICSARLADCRCRSCVARTVSSSSFASPARLSLLLRLSSGTRKQRPGAGIGSPSAAVDFLICSQSSERKTSRHRQARAA